MSNKGHEISGLEKRRLNTTDPLYRDALRLRYEVFFEPHGLRPEVVQDQLEPTSSHYALIEDAKLVAYGRLTLTNNDEAKISQMVVSPPDRG